MRRPGLVLPVVGLVCLVCLVCLVALAPVPPARADDTMYIGCYQMSYPVGMTQDWVKNESWVGLSIEGRHFLEPSLSVGGLLGAHSLYDRSFAVTQLGSFDVSGDQYRNLTVFPILGTVHVYVGDTEGTRLFAGVGAGAYVYRQLLDVGAYSLYETVWHVGVAPELGVSFPVEWNSRIFVQGRFHYPFRGGPYLDGQSHSYPFVSLGVGFGKDPL